MKNKQNTAKIERLEANSHDFASVRALQALADMRRRGDVGMEVYYGIHMDKIGYYLKANNPEGKEQEFYLGELFPEACDNVDGAAFMAVNVMIGIPF